MLFLSPKKRSSIAIRSLMMNLCVSQAISSTLRLSNPHLLPVL